MCYAPLDMKSPEQFSSIPSESPEIRLEALKPNLEKKILAGFSEAERAEIIRRRNLLSSLAYFIGKDFEIPVLLNEPGKGWYWDQERNHIKIDPKDLVEKPIDYLRFVIAHEAGHRRISRIIGVIPKDVWREPGFSFMFNALEDCRDNNFVAEAYPPFKDQMVFSYDLMDAEHKAHVKANAELGHQPKSIKAGFEYMKQWLREVKGEEFKIDADLPEDVKTTVSKTLSAAQDSWVRYPSKQEADKSEELITKYAEKAYGIGFEKVWPEFKKLVEKDQEKQKEQEALQKGIEDAQKQGQQEGQGEAGRAPSSNIPQDLNDKLSDSQRRELEDAISKAIDKANKAEPKDQQENEQSNNPEQNQEKKRRPIVDLDSLSDELHEKIREYIDGLPGEVKKALAEKAEQALKEIEKEIEQEITGKLVGTPDTEDGASEGKRRKKTETETDWKPRNEETPPDTSSIKNAIEEVMNKDKNAYEEYRREVIPVINELENDLREIFTLRRAHKWETGFKTGKKIDIKKRIQEKAKGVSPVESRAWQKRELPQEKDYAITLLVDLSGSMSRGGKIQETFKAVIVLAEVLNKLSIRTEILGFNDRLYKYQSFGESLSNDMREKMGSMLDEVHDAGPSGNNKANHNDDGWALTEVSARLAKEKAGEKFIIALSDGEPAPSPAHSGREFELKKVIDEISKNTDQKLIGLGVGLGTGHVSEYYPMSISNVKIEEMAETLSDLIKDAIDNHV